MKMSEPMEIFTSQSDTLEEMSVVCNVEFDRVEDNEAIDNVEPVTVNSVNENEFQDIFVTGTNNSKSVIAIVNDTCIVMENESKKISSEERILEVNGDPANIDRVNEDNNISKDTPIVTEPKKLYYNWSVVPKLLCSATQDYISSTLRENFTKGCQWSPDGTCLLVPAEDFRIRIYELPREFYNSDLPEKLPLENFKAALWVREGGLVYDACWYPRMNSWDPSTCCFLSTSRESPLHLWDAFTGELRATYRPYNQVDEVEAAISVQFVDGGREVWCGFKGALRSFNTDRPGRQKHTITLKNDFPNVNGLVSCIRENPVMPGLIAFGTYSKCIGLYKDGPLCSLKTDSGVTQIEFSPCGMKLYSAVRRSGEFLCWDLRNPGALLCSLGNRRSNTNQRIQFAVSSDGREIISGGIDGYVSVWKLPDHAVENEDLNPEWRFHLSEDCINGVSMHKSLPILATSMGQRICDDDEEIIRDNSVRLWSFHPDNER